MQVSIYVRSYIQVMVHLTFLLQTLLVYSTVGTINLFVCFSVLASVAALLLPIETRGGAMKVCHY